MDLLLGKTKRIKRGILWVINDRLSTFLALHKSKAAFVQRSRHRPRSICIGSVLTTSFVLSQPTKPISMALKIGPNNKKQLAEKVKSISRVWIKYSATNAPMLASTLDIKPSIKNSVSNIFCTVCLLAPNVLIMALSCFLISKLA